MGLSLCLIRMERLLCLQAEAEAAAEAGAAAGAWADGGVDGVRSAEQMLQAAPPRLVVRLLAVQPHTPLLALKSRTIGTLVSVRGTVARVSGVRPLVTFMTFICAKCSGRTGVEFPQGKYAPPAACSVRGCRSKTLLPDRPEARFADWQRIKLQELEADAREAGNIPRTVECELADDLVDSCVPGDVVSVAGIARAIEVDVAQGRGTQGAKSVFVMYIDARGVTTPRLLQRQQHPAALLAAPPPPLGPAAVASSSSSASTAQAGDPSLLFSHKELQALSRIRSFPDPLALLVASLCPGIFGHELVKAGLLLGLFGGTPKDRGDGAGAPLAGDPAGDPAGPADADTEGSAGRIGGSAGRGADTLDRSRQGPREQEVSAGASAPASLSRSGWRMHPRSDPHVLIVGEPGMGKSQMLKAVADLASRGVYVCGTTASSTGLTVTMTRDPVTGDLGLDAGALVLSDQGLCCIDEFDKMGSGDHDALLEAMDQQRVSIAKAGIVSSLAARASVIAAANPAGSHYDRAKTIQENLKKLSPAVLSRFDLVFLMLDRPDRLRDRQISEHVMAVQDASRAGWALANQASLRAAPGAGAAVPGAAADRRRQAGVLAAPASTAEMLESINLRTTQAAHAKAVELSRLTTNRSLDLSCSQAEWGLAGPPAGEGTGTADGGPSFEERLRRAVMEVRPEDIIPAWLLRRYVAYARQYCLPAMLPQAGRILVDFYLSLRRTHRRDDCTPITTRQLEAMFILAEARAKIELREYVIPEDAMDVVALMKVALFDAATDELGYAFFLFTFVSAFDSGMH
jgi:DNA helicase MCM8